MSGVGVNQVERSPDDGILQGSEPTDLLRRQCLEVTAQCLDEQQLGETTQELIAAWPSRLRFSDDVEQVRLEPIIGWAVITSNEDEWWQGSKGRIEATVLELQHPANEAQFALSIAEVHRRGSGAETVVRHQIGALDRRTSRLIDHRMIQIVQNDDEVALSQFVGFETFDLHEAGALAHDVEHHQAVASSLCLDQRMKEGGWWHRDPELLSEIRAKEDHSR